MKSTRQMTALTMSLALIFSLSACGNSSENAKDIEPISEVLPSTSQSAEESENETESDAETFLLNYAEQQSYLFGRDFDASLSKQADEYELFHYDLSQIPVQAIGYSIQDFDQDDDPELLIVSLSEVYTFKLEMYEYDNQEVILSDLMDLQNQEVGIPTAVALKNQNYNAIADFFTFGEEIKYIGIEISQLMSFYADGTMIDFLALTYYDGTLHLEQRVQTGGSDGSYDSTYMNGLAELNVFPPWDNLFDQKNYVREYVKNYKNMIRIVTSYTVDSKDAFEWIEKGGDSITCAEVHFDSMEEVESNTVQMHYHEPPENAAMLQAFASALSRFEYDEVWPDGIELEHDPEYYDATENRYAVYDVDEDGKLELMIQFTDTYTACMCDAVFDYDVESREFRWEFSEFPGCTFYSNGIVEARSSHNQSPSEFWPIALYRYLPDSDSYEEIGSVSALDEAIESDGFPYEADSDGNGRVYFINDDTPVDDERYEEWYNSIVGDAVRMDIPWENIGTASYDGWLYP